MSAAAAEDAKDDGTSSPQHVGLFAHLSPEILGRVSKFFSLGTDMISYIVILSNGDNHSTAAATIRRAYLVNNTMYLSKSLLRLMHHNHNFDVVECREMCRSRIVRWMECNADWRKRCTKENMELYQAPYVTVTIHADFLQEFLYKYLYPSGDMKMFALSPTNDDDEGGECSGNGVKKIPGIGLDKLERGACLVEVGGRDVVGLPWDEVFKLCGDIHFVSYEGEEEDDAHEDGEATASTIRGVNLTFMHHPNFIFNNASVATELELTDVLDNLAAEAADGSSYIENTHGFASYHRARAEHETNSIALDAQRLLALT